MKNKNKNLVIITASLLIFLILGGFGLMHLQISNFTSYRWSYLNFPEKLADDQDLYSYDGDIDNIQISITNVNISEFREIYLEIIVTSDINITSQSIINDEIELQEKSIRFRHIQLITNWTQDIFLVERDSYDLKPHSNLSLIIIAWELNNGQYILPENLSYFNLDYSVQYMGKIPLWVAYSFFLGALISLIVPEIIFCRKLNKIEKEKPVSTPEEKKIDVSENR